MGQNFHGFLHERSMTCADLNTSAARDACVAAAVPQARPAHARADAPRRGPGATPRAPHHASSRGSLPPREHPACASRARARIQVRLRREEMAEGSAPGPLQDAQTHRGEVRDRARQQRCRVVGLQQLPEADQAFEGGASAAARLNTVECLSPALPVPLAGKLVADATATGPLPRFEHATSGEDDAVDLAHRGVQGGLHPSRVPDPALGIAHDGPAARGLGHGREVDALTLQAIL